MFVIVILGRATLTLLLGSLLPLTVEVKDWKEKKVRRTAETATATELFSYLLQLWQNLHVKK